MASKRSTRACTALNHQLPRLPNDIRIQNRSGTSRASRSSSSPLRGKRPSSEIISSYSGTLVTNGKGSPLSALSTLLLGFGAVGGLALLVWLTLVMFDLKHLNTSGFTLP